jgi:hypothetical protein
VDITAWRHGLTLPRRTARAHRRGDRMRPAGRVARAGEITLPRVGDQCESAAHRRSWRRGRSGSRRPPGDGVGGRGAFGGFNARPARSASETCVRARGPRRVGENQVPRRLPAGGKEIRTVGPASKRPFQDWLLRFPGVRQCRSRGGPVAWTDRARQVHRLIDRLRNLGFAVKITPVEAAV